MPFDKAVFLPLEHGVRRELGAVVTDHHAWKASGLCNSVQLACDAFARQRFVGNCGKAFPAKVVNDTQDAEPQAVIQRIGYKVQAPALVASLRDGHRCRGSQSTRLKRRHCRSLSGARFGYSFSNLFWGWVQSA